MAILVQRMLVWSQCETTNRRLVSSVCLYRCGGLLLET